jgi:hypothetical protein
MINDEGAGDRPGSTAELTPHDFVRMISTTCGQPFALCCDLGDAAHMGRRPLPPDPHLLALNTQMRELAAPQGGVISAAQCRLLGVDDSAIRRLITCGWWKRARHRIYADTGFTTQEAADPAHHARAAALLVCLATPAVVSHVSAARLLGLPLPPGKLDKRVVITRRPPVASNDPLDSDVHVVEFDDVDVTDVDGVPVLAGARVVVDCCDSLSPDSALAVADAALARRITTVGALRAELRLRRDRPRSRIAELVVERADPLAESWFESISRWWLLEGGLPRPRLQVPFFDAQGRVRARVDMLVGRVVGEADGGGKYDDPAALFAEKQREDWLRDVHRLEVVRWVPAEMRTVHGRAEVLARFARAAARARDPLR